MSSRRRQGGFTLIEILVVMLLFALAGTLVFTSVGKSRTERRNRDFARELTGLCQKARRQAVGGKRPVRVRISEPRRRCWIEGGKSPVAIPAAIRIEAEGGGAMEEEAFVFAFYPDGSSDGVTLLLTAEEGFAMNLRIDMLTGLVERVADEDS